MRDLWIRIESVLRATAPERFARLPAGATTDALTLAEERLGLTLPTDVRESYAIHDGSGAHDQLPAVLLPHDTFGLVDVAWLSLAEVVRTREQWIGWRGEDEFARPNPPEPSSPIRPVWWSRGWVPVTWDGGGDHLCIDLDPAPGGVAGQVIYFSHEVGPLEVVAPSWGAYLEEFARDLEDGHLRYDAHGFTEESGIRRIEVRNARQAGLAR